MIRYLIPNIHKKSIKEILKIIKHGHLYLAYLIFKKDILYSNVFKKQWEIITENAFLHKLSGNRNQQTKDTYYDFVANTYYSNIRSIVE